MINNSPTEITLVTILAIIDSHGVCDENLEWNKSFNCVVCKSTFGKCLKPCDLEFKARELLATYPIDEVLEHVI